MAGAEPRLHPVRAGHGLAALVGVSVWALGCSSEPAPSASPGGSATPVVSGEPEPVDAAAPSVDAAPPPNGTPGCGAVVVSGLREGLALTVAGTPRTYTLWLPERYDPRRAHRLVVGLHSGGRTGASARPYLDLEGRSEGAVFVYPDAIRGNWALNTPYAQNPDFAFFDALMRELSDTCASTPRGSSRSARAPARTSRTSSPAAAAACCAPSRRTRGADPSKPLETTTPPAT